MQIDRTNEQIESNQMPMTTDYIESADWFNFRRLKRTVHDRPANAKMFFVSLFD